MNMRKEKGFIMSCFALSTDEWLCSHEEETGRGGNRKEIAANDMS